MQDKTDPEKMDFPNHPISLIIPYSAGGGMDLQGRALERLSSQYLAYPVVVVNKAGGAGAIAWNELAGAAPDGYTVGMTGNDVLLQPLFGPTKYQYLSALDPIAQVSVAPLIMVVNAGQPWQNLQDLIEYAKKHPLQLKAGHGGIGSMSHIIGESFAKLAGVQIEQVPFRGGSESTAALLGNHVQIVFTAPGSIKEQLKAGKLRALATTGEQRITDPVLAGIPTFKELGMDLVLLYRVGIAAPKVLPDEIKANLEASLKKMILDPAFKQNADALGVQVEYLDSEATLDSWISDAANLKKMVTETGVLEQVRAQKGTL